MQFRTLRGLFGVRPSLGQRSSAAGEQHQGVVVHAAIDHTGPWCEHSAKARSCRLESRRIGYAEGSSGRLAGTGK